MSRSSRAKVRQKTAIHRMGKILHPLNRVARSGSVSELPILSSLPRPSLSFVRLQGGGAEGERIGNTDFGEDREGGDGIGRDPEGGLLLPSRRYCRGREDEVHP